MVNHGKVQSCVMPVEMDVDEYSVWIASNIKAVTLQNGETQFDGYEYDLIQYDKNEVIKMQDEENKSLQNQINDTQLALVELYESLG